MKVYFEGAKKQTSNYPENALLHFFQDLGQKLENRTFRTFSNICEAKASGVLT